MLAQSARQHGYGVVVLTGGAENTPAGVLADQEITGAFDDPATVATFLQMIDAMTWEFENVDPAIAEAAEAAGVPARPAGSIIAAAQDRKLEKEALTAAGVAVAPWRSAETRAELAAAVAELGVPVIAKTARFGYDGKGQVRITDPADVAAVWEALGGERLVVESVIAFDRELSVVVARGVDGDIVDHGVMENTHANHILDTTTVPARVPDATAEAARATAHLVATGLGLVGVLCVELFDTAEGSSSTRLPLVPTTPGTARLRQRPQASSSSSCGRSPASRSVTAAVPRLRWPSCWATCGTTANPTGLLRSRNPVCTCTCTEARGPHGPKDGASHGGR